jgi:NAD(P)-dependent dehydrogenase (short-subunit alcohol dehydrogenase family)
MQEVLITGASSGIGAATAELFSSQGWKVYLLGRNIDKLNSVQKKLKGPSQTLPFDISQKTDCQKLAIKLKDLSTDISALVNNAGIYKPCSLSKANEENWLSQFETNFFAAIRVTQMIWPELVKNKGTITNVSSTLGLRPIENTGAYSASKAAMNSWTQTLALEGGPLGVRANAICPGLTDTPIHFFHDTQTPEHLTLRKKLEKMQPLGRMGIPSDIAQAIFYVSSPQASWMTGSLIPLDGGIHLTTRDPV